MTAVTASQKFIKRLAVIGVGLIGGSIALRLKEANCVETVVGVGRSADNLRAAIENGVIDEVSRDIKGGVRDADVIIIAVPVRQLSAILPEIDKYAPRDAVITDVGSTKSDFAELALTCLPDRLACVVPAHPIAGSEKTGALSARVDLFEGRNVVLCPLKETLPSNVGRIREMWKICDANVLIMSTKRHDHIFSVVSHLPHVVSYALVNMIIEREDADEVLNYAAGGFRDFTRIAGSSAEMWADICEANQSEILESLSEFIAKLKCMRELIEEQRYTELKAIFAAASSARVAWNTKK